MENDTESVHIILISFFRIVGLFISRVFIFCFCYYFGLFMFVLYTGSMCLFNVFNYLFVYGFLICIKNFNRVSYFLVFRVLFVE